MLLLGRIAALLGHCNIILYIIYIWYRGNLGEEEGEDEDPTPPHPPLRYNLRRTRSSLQHLEKARETRLVLVGVRHVLGHTGRLLTVPGRAEGFQKRFQKVACCRGQDCPRIRGATLRFSVCYHLGVRM